MDAGEDHLTELFATVSAAVDAMAKAENSLLAYGDVEIANVLSVTRVNLEDAARTLSTGKAET